MYFAFFFLHSDGVGAFFGGIYHGLYYTSQDKYFAFFYIILELGSDQDINGQQHSAEAFQHY